MTRGGFLARLFAAPLAAMGCGGKAAIEGKVIDAAPYAPTVETPLRAVAWTTTSSNSTTSITILGRDDAGNWHPFPNAQPGWAYWYRASDL